MQNEPNFEQMVKQAKTKSTLRTVVIAFLVTLSTLLILYGFIALGQWLMYKKMDEQAIVTMNTYSIYGANLTANSASYDHFFVAGTTKVHITKQIGQTSIPWDTVENFYTILGTESTIQSESTITVDEKMIEMNGHKEVSFQLPGTTSITDDTEQLAQLPDYTRLEVALSFDAPLPPEEVLRSYPESAWMWVPIQKQSSYFEGGIIAGREAYGFSVTDLSSLEFQVTDFQNKLIAQSRGFGAEEIEVAGVVLTGTLEQLRPYFERPEVTAVRAGVIIPY